MQHCWEAAYWILLQELCMLNQVVVKSQCSQSVFAARELTTDLLFAQISNFHCNTKQITITALLIYINTRIFSHKPWREQKVIRIQLTIFCLMKKFATHA